MSSVNYTNKRNQVEAPLRSFSGMEDLEEEVGESAAALEQSDSRPFAQRHFRHVDTTPMDRRFMNTNQSKHCFFKYNKWLDCKAKAAETGEGEAKCKEFFRQMQTICPQSWIENWETQREEGTFAGVDA